MDGRGAGFSLEVPEGKRFLTRSRMFDDDELQSLGLVPRSAASAGVHAPDRAPGPAAAADVG